MKQLVVALLLIAPLAARLAGCTATVDPAAIQQAMVNLLDNAIKFSPEDSEVRITLESTPSEWQLDVVWGYQLAG